MRFAVVVVTCCPVEHGRTNCSTDCGVGSASHPWALECAQDTGRSLDAGVGKQVQRVDDLSRRALSVEIYRQFFGELRRFRWCHSCIDGVLVSGQPDTVLNNPVVVADEVAKGMDQRTWVGARLQPIDVFLQLLCPLGD